MKKKILRMLLAGVLALSTLFVGCGGSDDKDKDANVQGEGPWYKPSYFDMTLDENEYMNVMQVYGDSMYYIKSKYNEGANANSYTFAKMNLLDHTVTEFPFSLEENYYLMDMFVNDSGIYLTTQMTEYDANYTKMLDYKFLIKQLDFEGNEVKVYDLTESMKAKNTDGNMAYVQSIACDKDGNLYASDNNTFVMVYDKEGNLIADIEKESWGSGLIASADGSVYYSYMDDATWETVVVEVDVENKKLGEKLGAISNSGSSSDLFINEDKQIYITEDNTLKLVDLTTGESSDVLYWLDYDINGNNIRFVREMEDGTIFAYSEDYGQEAITCELITIEETDQPIEEKTIITYATLGLDSDVSEAIIRFNKNNDTYRIKVVDYYDSEDYATGLDAYNEAILNGEVADIVNVSLESYQGYARKGLYADLNEFMNSDTEINRADYFENVLEAYEVDGKLYAVPTSFGVTTLVGKTSVWGEDALTNEKVAEIVKMAGDDAELMEYMTKMEWLSVSLMAGIDNYIDWETGKCSFDSEKFISVLELANQFPQESNWSEGDLSTPKKIQAGKILLSNEHYTDITGLQVTKAIFNEEVSFVGYPDAAGNGALIADTGNIVAISADSENKEGAWEFIRYLLSWEYQSNYIRWYTPLHKGAFEAQIKEATKIETYTDENGEEIESPHMTYGWEDFEVSVYAATEEDVADYTKLLEGATSLVCYEMDIMNIVEEEVAPYFNGQKTAKEVAGIIQGRVNIYVNENR